MKDFIKAFFSGLSDKERTIFYAAVGVVLIALLDGVVLGPVTRETSFLRDKIASEKTLIGRNLMILRYKGDILEKYEKVKPYFAEEGLTQEERIAELLNEIEVTAREAALALTNITPVVIEEIGSSSQYRVTIECLGKMDNLIEFIYGIDNSKVLLRVVSCTINPKNRDNYEVKATVTVEKLIVFPLEESFFLQ